MIHQIMNHEFDIFKCMIVVYSGSKFELKIKYDILKNGDFNEYVMSVSIYLEITFWHTLEWTA